MGRTAEKLSAPKIDLSALTPDKMKAFHLVYHDDEDVLFVRREKPQRAAAFDLEGELWIRFDPETGEIVGLEIDDFEAIFLKRHPELAEAWKEAKPLCGRKSKNKDMDRTRESFLLIILDFFLEFLRKNPQQAAWDIAPVQA